MALFKKKAATPPGSFAFQDMTRLPVQLAGDDNSYITNGYEMNADLFTVINLLTTNAANIKLDLFNGDKQLEKDPVLDLLKEPLPGVTYAKWIAQIFGFYLITGNAYIWSPWLESGVNKGKTTQLPWLPSQYMKVKRLNNGELEYTMQGAIQKKIPGLDILHITTPNYQYGGGRELYGMSPIKTALNNLSSSNDGIKAQAARFQNGGLDGILGVKDANTEQQVKKLKSDLEKQTGASKSGRFLVTSSGLDWIRFGLSSADLEILKTITWNLRVFANIYKVDPKLVDPTVGNTYNNMKEAYASMYNRAIIPFMRELANGLTNWLLPKYGKGLRFQINTSEISELQRDRSETVKWLKDAWWLTGNEKRIEQGYEPAADKEMDEIMYPQNSMPSSEAVEKALNDAGIRDYRT